MNRWRRGPSAGRLYRSFHAHAPPLLPAHEPPVQLPLSGASPPVILRARSATLAGTHACATHRLIVESRDAVKRIWWPGTSSSDSTPAACCAVRCRARQFSARGQGGQGEGHRYLVGHQAGACSKAPPHPFTRVQLCYAFGGTRSSLIVCKSMRRSCKTGWMDGWMMHVCVCVCARHGTDGTAWMRMEPHGTA
eukprot:364376-Chlamydomonas_euryale.AAC.3